MTSKSLVPVQQNTIQQQLLQVLFEMAKRFTSRSSEADVIEYIGEKTRELLSEQFSHLYVILQHRWTGDLQVVLQYEHGQKQIDISNQDALLQKIGLPAIHQIIHTRASLLFPDKKTIASHISGSENFSACWLGVPMNIAKRAIGAVIVCHPTEEYVYTETIREALDAVTDLAAAEIDHARLMQYFELLAHVEKELTGFRSNDEREVIRFIYEKVCEFTDIYSRNLAIVLQHTITGKLTVVFAEGRLFNADEINEHERVLEHLDPQRIQKILAHQEPLIISEHNAEIWLGAMSEDMHAWWLGVPMRIAKRSIGVFVTYHPDQQCVYEKDDVEILDLISDQAANALEKARLMKRLAVLAEIKKELSALVAPTEENVFEKVMEKADQIADTYNLSIFLQAAGTDLVELVFAQRKAEKVDLSDVNKKDAIITTMPMSAIREIIRTNGPRLFNTKAECQEAFEIMPEGRVPASWLGVPMRLGDTTIGVFAIYHMQLENVYDDDDIQILDDLSDQAAIALGNAKLFAAERQQRLQAQILQDVAHKVNARLERKEVCESVLVELRKVVPYSTASIQRIYGNKRTLIAYYGLPTVWEDSALLRDISEDSLIAEIVETRDSIVIPDTAHTSKPWEHRQSTQHVKSWMGIPLIAEDVVIGVLTIDHETSGFYTQNHQQAAMMFANHAATALLNAELFEQQKNYLTILEEVYPSLQAIGEGEEGLTSILQSILKNGVTLTGADYADLWLFHAQTEEIQVEMDFESKRSKKLFEPKPLRFNLKSPQQDNRPSIVGHVIATGSPYLCADVTIDPYYVKVGEDVRSELAIPLRHQNETIGVLNFESTKLHAFTPEHERILEALAAPTAIVIQNARLYHQLEILNTQQKTLLQIGQQFSLGMQRSHAEILELIYDQATKLPGMRDNFSIALYDDASDMVSFELAVVNGRRIHNIKQVDGWKPRRSGHGKTEEIIRTGKCVLLPTQEAVKERGFKPVPNKDYVGEQPQFARSWLGVPMRSGDKIIGALATYSYDKDWYYQEDDIEILQSLADYAAITLENAQLSATSQTLMQQFRSLVSIAQELTSEVELEESAVLDLIYAQASQTLNMKNFSIALYDKETDTVRFARAARHGQPVKLDQEPGWEYRIGGKGKTEEVIRSKLPLLLNSREAVMKKTEQVRLQVHKDWEQFVADAWLGVPMMVGDNILGVLADYRYGQNMAYSQAEVEVFQALANVAAIALDNSRLYGTIRESERRFADIIEFLPDATFVIDREGKVVAWNRAIEQMTGVKSEDILGHGEYAYSVPFYGEKRRILIDFALQPDKESEAQLYTNVRREGGILFAESHIPQLRGKEVYFWAATSVLLDSKGNRIGVIESVRDITELKKMQEALQEARDNLEQQVQDQTRELRLLNNQQQVLIALTQKLTASIQQGEADILELIHLQASQLMDTENMYIALYDQSIDTIRFPLMYENGEAKSVPPRKLDREKKGRTEEILITGQSILIRNQAESEAWYQQPGRQEFVGTITPSWIGVPMRLGERMLGVIATFHPSLEDVYNQNDLHILQTMANVAAIAFTNTRLYNYTERKQAALIHLAQTLTTQIQADEKTILQFVHDETLHLMDVNNMYMALYDDQTEMVRFPLMYENGESKSVTPRKLNKEKRGRTEEILITGQSIFIQTLTESKDWYCQLGRQEFVGNPYASWIGVPMRLGEKMVGVIATFHPMQEYAYTQDDLQILQTMANLAAIALENSRLYLSQQQQTALLQQQAEALEEANRRIAEKQDVLTRSMIATDFVHRMNNLAGTIPAWAGIIREEFERREPDRVEIFDCVDHIIKDANGLLRAAEQLKTSHQNTELDISFMLQSILRQVEIQFAREIQKNRQLTIEKDIETQLPRLWGNRASLSHALFNVISNGIDAILLKGSGTLTVRAKSSLDEQHNEWVKIEVEDTGIGIAEGNRHKIFTPLFTTKATGGGYGLWRSKTVVEEEFLGTITLSPPQDIGTTFTIMLPKRSFQEE